MNFELLLKLRIFAHGWHSGPLIANCSRPNVFPQGNEGTGFALGEARLLPHHSQSPYVSHLWSPWATADCGVDGWECLTHDSAVGRAAFAAVSAPFYSDDNRPNTHFKWVIVSAMRTLLASLNSNWGSRLYWGFMCMALANQLFTQQMDLPYDTSRIFAVLHRQEIPEHIEDTENGTRAFWVGEKSAEKVMLFFHGMSEKLQLGSLRRDIHQTIFRWRILSPRWHRLFPSPPRPCRKHQISFGPKTRCSVSRLLHHPICEISPPTLTSRILPQLRPHEASTLT